LAVVKTDHYQLGFEGAAKGDYITAVREFSLAKRQNPKLPGIDKQIGLALFRAKDYQRAAIVLTEARREEPDDMQVLLALGSSLARLGKTDVAQRVFADLLKRHSDSPELHLL